jgi:putative spermidine/putrescine transport system ATP-binding protein
MNEQTHDMKIEGIHLYGERRIDDWGAICSRTARPQAKVNSMQSSSALSAREPDAIALKGISKMFGSVVAVHPTNLEVRKGEFLTLLGPSGSGKTTLLNLIAGGIAASSGSIFLDGRDITTLPPRDRGIGMVFQNYALMPHMTVFENVAYPLRVRHESAKAIRAKVLEALNRVGLQGFEERKPRQLSGGQQQRVGIARCIVYSPAIIMMDEPLGALDKNLREQMQDEIKRLHKDLGTTVIYVTHDQEEALNMSDRICLMRNGEIAQLGTPDDLYFRPSNRFVAEFIGESNLIGGRVSNEGNMAIAGGGCISISGAAALTGSEAIAMIRPEKVRIDSPAQPLDGNSNEMRGKVTSTSFIGGMTRVTVLAENGLSIVAKMVSDRAESRPEPGTLVRLSWSPSDMVLLEK